MTSAVAVTPAALGMTSARLRAYRHGSATSRANPTASPAVASSMPSGRQSSTSAAYTAKSQRERGREEERAAVGDPLGRAAP
jgi:hypothetical protein